jgi:hypothetical protein
MRRARLFLLLLTLSACALFGPRGPHYVVFFQERSAQLDASARAVIAQVARRANADPAAPVEVRGYTDSSGSPPADVLLSRERVRSVADALVSHGVAANRLVRKGRDRRVPTQGSPAGGSRSLSAAIRRMVLGSVSHNDRDTVGEFT